MKYITVEELKKSLEKQPDLPLIDVRSPEEYRVGHIPEAKSLPLDTILDDPFRSLKEIESFLKNEDTLYVVCLSDRRSFIACQKLAEVELYNTCFVKGGTHAWMLEGFPVVSETNL